MIAKPELLKTSFGSFERAFERLLTRNRILTPPVLTILERDDFALPMVAIKDSILPDRGIVSVSRHVAAQGETTINNALCAHEVGHLLSDHPVGISVNSGGVVAMDTRNLPDFALVENAPNKWSKFGHQCKLAFRILRQQRELVPRYKNQEHEADRIAAHLIDSVDGVRDMRTHLSPGGAGWESLFERQHSDAKRDWKFRVRKDNAIKTSQKLYGSLQENLNNLDRVDLSEREWVDNLISKRERDLSASSRA